MRDVSLEKLSPSDVAEACGVSLGQLVAFARDPDLLFKPRIARCVKGKVRELDPPTPAGKRLLKRLHRLLQAVLPPGPMVHGGAKGRSCFTSARKHVGRAFIVKRDIRRCYPSIGRDLVMGQLTFSGVREDTARLLTDLLVVRGCVSQGSPASGDALNIVLATFDVEVQGFCATHGLRASRTYDDVVVSTNDRTKVEIVGQFIEDRLAARGLEISERKKRRNGLQTQSAPKERPPTVHSLVVSKSRGVAIGRQQRERAIRLAEAFRNGCRAATPSSLSGLARLRRQVVGHLRYVGQADVGPKKNLRQLIDAGDRAIARRVAGAGVPPSGKPWHYQYSGYDEPARIEKEWDIRLDQAKV